MEPRAGFDRKRGAGERRTPNGFANWLGWALERIDFGNRPFERHMTVFEVRGAG
jgi:hypothetical protein